MVARLRRGLCSAAMQVAKPVEELQSPRFILRVPSFEGRREVYLACQRLDGVYPCLKRGRDFLRRRSEACDVFLDATRFFA